MGEYKLMLEVCGMPAKEVKRELRRLRVIAVACPELVYPEDSEGGGYLLDAFGSSWPSVDWIKEATLRIERASFEFQQAADKLLMSNGPIEADRCSKELSKKATMLRKSRWLMRIIESAVQRSSSEELDELTKFAKEESVLEREYRRGILG